jgi:Ca2+-binding RTX toxin-like protein
MRAFHSGRTPSFEQLENRRLLAPVLSAGTLAIPGTPKNDRIIVSETASEITVRVKGDTFRYDTDDVTQIYIDARKGNDWIRLDVSVTTDATLIGGQGNDKILAGGGIDSVFGGPGNDHIFAGAGNDTISGGAGNDWIWGQDGDDSIHGDVGHDHVFGGAGLDQLWGDFGHDHLFGDEDNDTLHGGDGHDQVHGNTGDDLVYGDAGNDLLFGDDGQDQLFGGDDHDHLWGGADDDILKGGAGNDKLDGLGGNNLLDGDAGTNQLVNGFQVDVDDQLIALLTSSGAATAEATYQQVIINNQVETELVIEVEQATPGPLDVTIEGDLVGPIVIEADGTGRVVFSSDPVLGESLPLPDGLDLQVGSTIMIGLDLSGPFAARFP